MSRSGYYNYFSKRAQVRHQRREAKDLEVKEIILKAFKFKRRKKGAWQIKMTLAGQFNINYNLKRIGGTRVQFTGLVSQKRSRMRQSPYGPNLAHIINGLDNIIIDGTIIGSDCSIKFKRDKEPLVP